MFYINEDKSIYATRGDIVFFHISAEMDGKPYKFKESDIVRISIYEKKACDRVALVKDFAVDEDGEYVGIYLEEKDTKIGGIINKPVDYWYEIVLNPDTNPQTIVGYDDDGAKIFKLFPEGKELDHDDDVIYDETKLNVQDAIEKAVEDQFGQMPMDELIDEYFEKNPVGCDTFIATYGETTYEELVNAHNENKAIVLKGCDVDMQLLFLDEGEAQFRASTETSNYVAACDVANDWFYEVREVGGAHADSHAPDGDDPLFPEDIGAAPEDHTHTPADIGAAVNLDFTGRQVVKSRWVEYETNKFRNTLSFTAGSILTSDAPIVDVRLGTDIAANAITLQEWAKVAKVEATADKIHLFAYYNTPEVDLYVNVKVVR